MLGVLNIYVPNDQSARDKFWNSIVDPIPLVDACCLGCVIHYFDYSLYAYKPASS